ncbi:uncharacterized protein LTR77_001371 [Saxophila tyrrhenica]|uniref:Uncharacterized protein n=1 Tax=Saxophila tyrrhenica TaxID=1690608 RepID=A0AAV9PN24_9PEZI|nr:hypothetical protein LTR77_001371 [Saxophila tyrrhenica]
MPPIPIAMAGKIIPHAHAFSKLMLPEYEIIFRFQSAPEFHSSFPFLMKGTPVNPESQIGTNTDNPNPKIPAAIFVGGGFSDDELESMRAVPEAKMLPWVSPSQSTREEVRKVGDLMSREQREGGPGEGVMEVVVRRVKECLKEHGVVEGGEGLEGKDGGELWRC